MRFTKKKKKNKLPYQDDPLYLFIPNKGNLRTIAMDITLLKKTKRNPRINEPAVPVVIESIKAVGFRDPIEVDTNNRIVAGHTRYEAALQLKMKMVPVVVSVYDNDKQKFKYMVLNNKTGEYAQWDNEQLALVKDDFGFTPEELGFTEKEFLVIQPPSEKDMDAIPDKPKKITSKLGMIYNLGKHKLYCMDVLSGLRKLKDESVNMVVTSPPYWGLRDYGLPEIIFGGDKSCKHVWGKKKKRILTDTSKVGGFQGKAFKNNKDMAKAYAAEGVSQVCQVCSAWKGQLGLEPTPEMFIEHLVEIFSEVKRVLRTDGTCWINIGDSYCSSQAGFTPYRVETSIIKNKPTAKAQRRAGSVCGMKAKDRIGVPHMLAFAMRKAGWYWRDEIIWHKPSCLPESVRDRCTKNHEFIFMFTKRPKYFYDQELIRDDYKTLDVASNRKNVTGFRAKSPVSGKNAMSDIKKTTDAFFKHSGANKRSVWSISTEVFNEAHFATFPSKLIKPCILAGCPREVCSVCGEPKVKIMKRVGGGKSTRKSRGANLKMTQGVVRSSSEKFTCEQFNTPSEGVYKVSGYNTCECKAAFTSGIVLDPFMGAGTTMIVAEAHNRKSIGFELSPEYCDIIRRRYETFTKKD